MSARAGMIVLGIALIFGLGFNFGSLRGDAKVSDYKAQAERAIAQAARQEAAASEHAREVEKAAQERVERLARAYEVDRKNAQEAADRTIADLRSGSIRLRKLWEADKATDRLSDTATATRHADEVTRLRQEAVGRIHGIGAEADAQVKGLQALVNADRGR
ncbi:hypothetical protein IP90_00951 [Luteimonas cucumeris]|uniref:Uncharacterized protein n=1 Tax=Luteimonas cucumeris TaxID=985012 RepID=A0A562LAW9_9GAMM|nr:hypothetical protein [Luteimonas cucumeris]TWI04813.1 hypothetical protein IP90_00951 [Luteimonas cucumeris]